MLWEFYQCALFIRKVYDCNDSQEALLYINNHLVKMEDIIADYYAPLWRDGHVENLPVRQFADSRLIRSTASFIR